MTTKANVKLNDGPIGELATAIFWGRRSTRKILAMFLMTGSAFAQTTTFTGVIKTLSFRQVTGGQVTFSSTPLPESTVTTMQRLAPFTITCNDDTKEIVSDYTGRVLPGACMVPSNAALSPTGRSHRSCTLPNYVIPNGCIYDYAMTPGKDVSSVVLTSTDRVDHGGNSEPTSTDGNQDSQGAMISCGTTKGCTTSGPFVAKGVNGVLNAGQYCTTPGVLDHTCIENAVLASSGKQIFVPAGTYTGTDSTVSSSNLHLVLDPAASLSYNLSIVGSGYYRSSTVSSAGNYSAGATTLAGDFSAYSPGQTVIIEQVVNNGTVPVDFAKVLSASRTQLVLTAGTHFGYSNPNISKISNIIRYSGSTAAGAVSIPGNYTGSFSVGDVLRIENTTGTDSPGSSNAYFEMVRIKAITTKLVTFETSLHSAFGNPWLAKMQVLSNITVQGNGGYINQLKIENARQVSVSGLITNDTIAQYIYNFKFSDLHGAATGPSAFYWTFLWNGSISNIVANGATSTTDNGNVKLLGVQNTSVSSISTWGGE